LKRKVAPNKIIYLKIIKQNPNNITRANMMTLLLKYEVTGPERKTPIVLVPPGALRGWIVWKPHAEALSKKNKVIRVQLLNVAYSEDNQFPPKDYSLRWESQALKNTLEKLGIPKAHLVGWSHGGQVALDFALNNPAKTATITLIEPSVYWLARAHGITMKEEQDFRAFYDSLHVPPTENDLIGFLKLTDLVPEGTDPKSLPTWPDWNKMKTTLLGLHTDLEHSDDVARLRLLSDKRVLLVKGKESTLAVGVDLLAKELPNAKVLVLPDGHASHIVAQDQFIDELEKFITSYG
jgi:pimeloyl-ACP methyl ester carboxylesterase